MCAPASSADSLQVNDLRGAAPPDPHTDDVDPDHRPALVLTGQPQPGQPAQPADLLRGHSVRQTPKTVAGTGLDLDEHHRAVGLVGSDHIKFAIAAAPVTFQDPQTHP